MITGTRAKATIRRYIAVLPAPARARFKRFRAAILAAAPGGVDVVSYGIPAVQFAGRILVWYAAFTGHCSLYPMGARIRRIHARAIRGYRTSAGTIRFPWDRQPSPALVKRLVRARIAELRTTHP